MNYKKNLFWFFTYKFLLGLWMFSAIAVIYFQSITESYAMAMLVYSLISITTAVFEVPTSLICDRWGRKLNLVITALLMFFGMLAWSMAGVYKSFLLLIIGSVLRGVGVAFLSGTDAAFLYENLKDIRATKKFALINSKVISLNQLGLFISATTCMVATYYNNMQILAYISTVTMFLLFCVSLLLKNPKFHIPKDKSYVKQLKRGIKLFLKNKKLRSYTILDILNTSINLNIYRIEGLYFLSLVPLYIVSAVRVLSHGLGALSAYLMNLLRRFNFLILLFYSILSNSTIRFIALLLNNPLTPFISSLQNVSYGVIASAQSHLQQREYSKDLRATMSSAKSFFEAISIGLLGYVFGIFADITSPRVVLFAALFLQIINAFFYKKLFNKHAHKPKTTNK